MFVNIDTRAAVILAAIVVFGAWVYLAPESATAAIDTASETITGVIDSFAWGGAE